MSHIRRGHYRRVNGKQVFVRPTLVRTDEPIELENGACYKTSCPDCGETCFFYRSKKGGSTWFSQLGTPWPKHPCVNRGLGFGTAPPEDMRDLLDDIDRLPDEG